MFNKPLKLLTFSKIVDREEQLDCSLHNKKPIEKYLKGLRAIQEAY